MKSMRTWGWMLACAVLASCAQVGSPSGGPKDETPPELVAAHPELGATQVDDRRMVLEFDEYVKASNWRSQLLVSPPLDGAVGQGFQGLRSPEREGTLVRGERPPAEERGGHGAR